MFLQTIGGIATALMNHWLKHTYLQPLEASPVSLELDILLLIRTGWKDFDSHTGIWTSTSFSITGWLWYRTFCGYGVCRNGKLSNTYEAGNTLSMTGSSWTLHTTLSKKKKKTYLSTAIRPTLGVCRPIRNRGMKTLLFLVNLLENFFIVHSRNTQLNPIELSIISINLIRLHKVPMHDRLLLWFAEK